MTVTAQTPLNSYTGNGSTTEFSYTFKLLDVDDLFVSVNDVEQTNTVDYSVSGVGNNVGGTVTFVVPPPNGETVRLERVMTLTQTVDLTEGGALPSDTLDDLHDRLVMMVQDLNRRSLQALEGTDALDAKDNRVINVSTPTQDDDAATKEYVDDAVTTVTSLDGLTNVTITSNSAGEILKWNGSVWVNNTLAEAGAAPTVHTHTESDITDLGNYSVVGHTHTESQITDLGAYLENITGEVIGDLSNVTLTAPSTDDLLKYNGSAWVNDTIGFLELDAVPASFSGGAYKFLRVNAAEDAVVFEDAIFEIQMLLTTAANSDYTLVEYAYFPFTVLEAHYRTASGTIEGNVKIGSTSITGLSSLSFSTTQGNASASSNNSVSVGNRLLITTTSNSSSNNMSLSLRCRRN